MIEDNLNSDLNPSPVLFRNISRALKTIEICNEMLFHALDENSFLNDLCRLIVEEGGYLLAWVGKVGNHPLKSIDPIAYAGSKDAELKSFQTTWGDATGANSSLGIAVRSGRPYICRDMVGDPSLGSWRNEALKRGFASSITIPLTQSGDVFATVQIYAKEPYAFDEKEVDLLSRLAKNMTFGIVTLREHSEREKAIASLRQSEEQYRTLVEQASDGILITDLEGKILEINPSGCLLLKSTRDKLIGRTFNEFVYEEDQPETEKDFQALLQGKNILKERTLKLKEGASILTEVSSKMISPDRCYFFVRDISKRKKMEEELLKESRLESIGHLAGGIAHDFNNLLTGILGNISLSLASLDQSNPVFSQLASAERASLRAQELASQLLTFSKGGSPLKKEASIIELIKESASFVSRSTSISFQYSFPENTRSVEIDRGQITQVLNNLLLNAIQASPKNGIIELSVENFQSSDKKQLPLKPGSYVRVTVKDHGIGISKRDLKRIFDPFFSTKSGGTGLGLATSYSIVKKHGGEMIVESELAKGATISFYLPALEKPVLAPREKNSALLSGKGKILLMDDEEMILSVATNMLNKLGYGVVIARNASEAVSIYQEAFITGNPFDAVILDLTIPGGIGGKEALKRLLEIDPSVKAIASSGYSNDAVRSDWSQHQFRGFLAKPYRLSDLGYTLSQITSINNLR